MRHSPTPHRSSTLFQGIISDTYKCIANNSKILLFKIYVSRRYPRGPQRSHNVEGAKVLYGGSRELTDSKDVPWSSYGEFTEGPGLSWVSSKPLNLGKLDLK